MAHDALASKVLLTNPMWLMCVKQFYQLRHFGRKSVVVYVKVPAKNQWLRPNITAV